MNARRRISPGRGGAWRGEVGSRGRFSGVGSQPHRKIYRLAWPLGLGYAARAAHLNYTQQQSAQMVSAQFSLRIRRQKCARRSG